ncbi:transcriptional regulator [Kitasatospora acidiphila]|uniref:Transcriptional regulator n=2 Tax=Kitasatospora acidiphila TaxID=2567942 RepID=A0A540WDV0_9ACTN|nr:transcriptional regulator [Kitasatospora acidiphila]
MAPDGIGALLRGIREADGRSREEQALLLQELQDGQWFDPENLKRWETERRMPVPRWHGLLAEGYGLTQAQIMAAVAASRRWRRLRRAADDGAKGGEKVDRRRFLAAAAAVTGAAPLSGMADARRGIDAGLSGSDAGDLAYLDAAFERHRGGYHGRSPVVVLGEMRQDLDLLRSVLARPHPAGTRAGLARTAAGITGLVAIIQHDRGDQRDAHGWFATAERAAREAGDRTMLAWVLARHAMVPLNYGAPAAAAQLAEQARHEAGRRPSAPGALAAAVAARALAAVGERQGALDAVAEARAIAERLDATQAADTWFGYPAQKHHVHMSQALTLLGRTRDARAEQDAALVLTRAPSIMTHALLKLDAATCLGMDGDHGGAADLAMMVWQQLPDAYREGLVRSRAEALHRTLDGPAHRRLGDLLAS